MPCRRCDISCQCNHRTSCHSETVASGRNVSPCAGSPGVMQRCVLRIFQKCFKPFGTARRNAIGPRAQDDQTRQRNQFGSLGLRETACSLGVDPSSINASLFLGPWMLLGKRDGLGALAALEARPRLGETFSWDVVLLLSRAAGSSACDQSRDESRS